MFTTQKPLSAEFAEDGRGERGEFHTCVYAGPMFTAPLSLDAGEVVQRDRFVYADFTLRS